MNIDVPAADDDRIQLVLTIPVKGRKPLKLVLPRYDFLPIETFRAVKEAADKASADVDDMGRESMLSMLRHVTSDTEYAVLESLVPGQLSFIVEKWREHSVSSLGELLASSLSSMSMEAPSSSTSLAAVGDSTTSGAA